MADDVLVDNGDLTDYTVASEELTGGKHLQSVELHTESAGSKTKAATASNPLRVDPTGTTTQPVSGPLTDAQLRASAVPVSGTVTASGPLTDAQLRASAVPVSGPLTDAQLRASAVPVSLAHPALTASAPASASVGTTSAQAVAANAGRKGLVLVNRSNAVISIAFGASAAVVDDGITLEPMGGSFTMTKDTFTTAAVNAIAGSAASKLAIQEFA